MCNRRCRFNLAVLIAVAMTLASAPARAGGVEPDDEPPGELRILTFFDETTTSKCIGRPETPVCAVETLRACLFRKQPELCAAVGYAMPNWPILPVSESQKRRSHRYKVVEVSTLAGADIPPYYRDRGDSSWRAGDVRVVLRLRFCGPAVPSPDHCGRWWKAPFIHITRRVGERWRVVSVVVPRVEQ